MNWTKVAQAVNEGWQQWGSSDVQGYTTAELDAIMWYQSHYFMGTHFAMYYNAENYGGDVGGREIDPERVNEEFEQQIWTRRAS